ncbi:MAG: phosphoribosylamine--glycine ligase [Gammaproteobacteria bacterium]
MHVLIIGNGGREHAMASTVAESSLVTQVYVAPGNGGTAMGAPRVQNVDIQATDINALLAFAMDNRVDLTIVGPEAPLVLGIVDRFRENNLLCFGPTQICAQLEGSKAYCKAFLKKNNIPTAGYETFDTLAPALAYIEKHALPIVIKADGLAAGKGVVIAQTHEEARDTLKSFLTDHSLGDASKRVVIEAFLAGRELSFIVMSDGKDVVPLATSQDHKRRDDGDKGPNTGGMGAFSPADKVSDALHDEIMRTVIHPTLNALRDAGTPYTGFLYAGIMLDANDKPFVLEFNCRLGDPETQPLLTRLTSDFTAHCLAACEGRLAQEKWDWDPRTAVGVVVASKGYPDKPEVGKAITLTKDTPDIRVYHAGTTMHDGQLRTSGGRVLCVTALGNTKHEAAQRAYEALKSIHVEDGFYRKDIGL